MTFEIKSEPQKVLSRRITVAMAVAAALLGMLALYRANHYPRTDDAEVFANFIGIAPQVEGPIVRLNVHDNQFVRKGELLYEIDERPYQFALEKAVSDQSTLEGQITDEKRRIAALVSAVSGAQAGVHSAQAETTRWAAANTSVAVFPSGPPFSSSPSCPSLLAVLLLVHFSGSFTVRSFPSTSRRVYPDRVH